MMCRHSASGVTRPRVLQQGPYTPYQHSGRTFGFGPADRKVLDFLRDYRADLCQGVGGSRWVRRICGVSPGVFFDIVCKARAQSPHPLPISHPLPQKMLPSPILSLL